MFLCKLRLDPNHAEARRDLADPYEMHSSLARAVAPDPSGPPPRFLWRLEKPGRAAELLVQSPVRPVWSRLGAVTEHDEKEFDPAALVRQGQFCRFRLKANPTVTRDGKRHGLGKEEDQVEWLWWQGECHGFIPRSFVRTETGLMRTRQRKGGGNRITVLTAGFEGLLEVTDPALLSQALVGGLGHAKALGLGLLSLARA